MAIASNLSLSSTAPRRAPRRVRTIKIPANGPVEVLPRKLSFKEMGEYIASPREKALGEVGMVQLVSSLPIDPNLVAMAQFNEPEGDLIAMDPNKTPRMHLIAHEEGKLIGLPLNLRATLICNLGYELVGDIILLDGYTLR